VKETNTSEWHEMLKNIPAKVADIDRKSRDAMKTLKRSEYFCPHRPSLIRDLFIP
jgi:hypothetical protein